jgi:hypothetical protein
MFLADDCLIVLDYRSFDRLIHLFDRNTYAYLCSAVPRGQGPGEVANPGHIGIDEARRRFYISDHGKQTIFDCALDSVLANPRHVPGVKMKMNAVRFPGEYHYINDTLCYGVVIEPSGSSDFNPSVAKWNMTTGEITAMKYTHPEVRKKRIHLAVSPERGIYAECYSHHDLITICTLDGELMYNIYGNSWSSETTNRITYYGKAAWCGDRLFVLYSGKETFPKDGRQTRLPTAFIVFDAAGNYICTLETGFCVSDFCYDERNSRIVMTLDDEMQFAFLPLAEVDAGW